MTPLAVAQSVRKCLPASYLVEPQPDHPHLLSGPHLLVGGQGRLLSVFMVNSATSSLELEARLIAARLALPSATQAVAITSANTAVEHPALRHFDAVLSEEACGRTLAKLIQSPNTTKVKLSELKHTKRVHALRWSACRLMSSLRHKRALRLGKELSIVPFPDSTYSNLPAVRETRHLGVSEVSPHASVIQFLRNGRGLSNDLKSAWLQGLTHGYRLIDGTPHAEGLMVPLLLLAPQWPHLLDEGRKHLDAMAFSGWIVAVPESETDAPCLLERAEAYLRKTLREKT